ncbi:MFS transporter [Paraburkholderia nemoris]|uniref:MFS transporter n=1 Tax=Paraburkholderia nemoris TaxID=2793076 RepID=UPI0038BBD9A6
MKSIVAEHPSIALLKRVESIGFTRLHRRARLIMGTATFFDAFDVLTIAYVMPVLIPIWHLGPRDIGLLIAASFIGQIFGAIFFGWLAERIGRVPSAGITIAIMSIMGIGCGFAWSFQSLLFFRVLQGIGMGGEVPIAAAYINELCGAHKRGRFFLFYEALFVLGLVGAAAMGTVLVPRFGWNVMFFVGALPALGILLLIPSLKESPRWLIEKGRLSDANDIIQAFEKSGGIALTRHHGDSENYKNVAPVSPANGKAEWKELFSPQYRARTFTVWGLWICVYFVNYGLNTWLPTVYNTVYGFSVSDSLRAGLLTNVSALVAVVVCATCIDRLGRKVWFLLGFLAAGIPLLILGGSSSPPALAVLALTTLSFAFVTTNSMVVYLYTPEIYPTRIRAVATGIASSMLRIASAIGPIAVGFSLHAYGVHAVFLLFGIVSVIGAFFATRAVETREKPLEEISL